MKQPVNYVLDADIRSFFGSVDHELMLRALSVRIADRRILRLIRQWLKVGILEGEECEPSEEESGGAASRPGRSSAA